MAERTLIDRLSEVRLAIGNPRTDLAVQDRQLAVLYDEATRLADDNDRARGQAEVNTLRLVVADLREDDPAVLDISDHLLATVELKGLRRATVLFARLRSFHRLSRHQDEAFLATQEAGADRLDAYGVVKLIADMETRHPGGIAWDPKTIGLVRTFVTGVLEAEVGWSNVGVPDDPTAFGGYARDLQAHIENWNKEQSRRAIEEWDRQTRED